MEEKDVSGFRVACEIYFNTLPLNALRAYGRALQLKNPTAMKKGDLIETILKVLCGEIVPKRNNRGAPIKDDYLDNRIFERVANLQKRYLQKEMPTNGEHEENLVKEPPGKPPLVSTNGETFLEKEPLLFTVRFSLLNDVQKNLFINFLKSL